MLDTPKPPRRASPWEGPAPSVSNYMCEYSAAPRPRRIPFIMISTVSLSHSHTHQNHIHIVSISLSAGLIMGIKNRFSSAVTSPSVRLVFSRVRRVFVAAIVTINTGKVMGSLIFRNPESHAHHVFYFCHFCLLGTRTGCGFAAIRSAESNKSALALVRLQGNTFFSPQLNN